MRRQWLAERTAEGFTLLRKACGFALVCSAFAGRASAVDVVVPELDPGSMTGALALLTGGVLLLTDRFRRK